MKNIFIGIGLTSLLAFVAINFFTQGRAEVSARSDITNIEVSLTKLQMDKRRIETFSDLTDKKNEDALALVDSKIAAQEKILSAAKDVKEKINVDTEAQRQDANDAASTLDSKLSGK